MQNALKFFVFFSIILLCGSCFNPTNSDTNVKSKLGSDSIRTKKNAVIVREISAFEQQFVDSGLVDVVKTNPKIRVFLRYATDSNFLKRIIYPSLKSAYLEKNTAQKLAVAQQFLSEQHAHLHLLIWDAARPVSSQQIMWNSLDMPSHEKGRFVSNPANHSLHNYGCAVDVTLADQNGKTLDMGTDFDQFDTLAQPKFEMYCLQNKKLTQQQFANRMLLRNVMKKAGFSTISSEWWHFNSCSRWYAKEHFKLIK
ncbi:MAG: M15 family metallopeptidase [Bacteroidia bacterium]